MLRYPNFDRISLGLYTFTSTLVSSRTVPAFFAGVADLKGISLLIISSGRPFARQAQGGEGDGTCFQEEEVVGREWHPQQALDKDLEAYAAVRAAVAHEEAAGSLGQADLRPGGAGRMLERATSRERCGTAGRAGRD